MLPTINLLIANRHPITAQAYKNSLAGHLIGLKFQVRTCFSKCVASTVSVCEKQDFNVVIADTNISLTSNGSPKSMQGLCLHIKKMIPMAKIIITTSFNDNYRLFNILSNINPDGLLLKSDITNLDLSSAVKEILYGNPFYSSSVIKFLRNKISQNITIDDIDTKILIELSNGSKMMDLLKHIPLTKSGIEKRKRRLKNIFKTKTNSDRELVLFAKKNGYI